MGRRAVAYLETQKGDLLIECRAPLPEIDRKPQEITLRVNGREHRLTLRDHQWQRLLIPVPEPRDAMFCCGWKRLIPLIRPGPSGARTIGIWVFNCGSSAGKPLNLII